MPSQVFDWGKMPQESVRSATRLSDSMTAFSQRNAKVNQSTTVLVTGATGYIGGRLAPRLLDEGHRVRVLAPAMRHGCARVHGGDRVDAERLPAMICPRWVYSRIQPIAVGDVLDYLTTALMNTACDDTIIEIGGSTVTTWSRWRVSQVPPYPGLTGSTPLASPPTISRFLACVSSPGAPFALRKRASWEEVWSRARPLSGQSSAKARRSAGAYVSFHDWGRSR